MIKDEKKYIKREREIVGGWVERYRNDFTTFFFTVFYFQENLSFHKGNTFLSVLFFISPKAFSYFFIL